MSEVVLATIAVLAALSGIRAIRRLDRLAGEFRQYAVQTRSASTGIIRALVDHKPLDKHQRILRAETLTDTLFLAALVSGLVGIVLISF